MTQYERQNIEETFVAILTVLLETCHTNVLAIRDFLPHCKPNITSDVKAGIHQLAGSACAAYKTVLVNGPSLDEKKRIHVLLKEIRDLEDELMEVEDVQ